jgi:hypothetical protein
MLLNHWLTELAKTDLLYIYTKMANQFLRAILMQYPFEKYTFT